MSLYNNVAESVSGGGLAGSIGSGLNSVLGNAASALSGGLTGAISSGLNSALGSAAGTVSDALGGGKLANTVASIGKSMASNAAMNLVNKYVPLQAQQMVNLGASELGDILQGNWEAAGMRLLDSGLLGSLLPGMGGVASQMRYWGTPTPLFGGISPSEARNIYDEIRGVKLARKNLWMLEVSSPLLGDISQPFNLFATDVEYDPFIITAEKRRIGGSVVDSVQGAEPVELRITTTDDQQGTIKRWFSNHHAAIAASDGTVGVPGSYAVRIKVVHAFITASSNKGGYEDIGLFRPTNMTVSLSRRENGLEELQMTFSQLDTFMQP